MAKPTKKEIAKKEEDADFVRETRTGLESFFSATSQLRQDIYDDFQMTIGGERQWKGNDLSSLKGQNRPAMAFNAIAPIVNFVHGYQLEREQDYRAFPRGSEDEQLGRIMTALMKYAMDSGGGEQACGALFRKGYIGGLSVMEVLHSFDRKDDLLEGEIEFNVLPENAWACEVGARLADRSDASWQTKLMWMTPDEAKREWPSQKDALKTDGRSGDWLMQDPMMTGVPAHLLAELYDAKTGRIRILQRWYRVPTTVALVVNTQSGAVERFESETAADDYLQMLRDQAGASAVAPYRLQTGTSMTDMVHVESGQVMKQFLSPDDAGRAVDLIKQNAGAQATQMFDTVTRDTTSLRVAHLTGWKLLDDGPSPNGADWRYPFHPFIWCQETDDYSSIKGGVRDLKDPQSEINWHHSTMLDSLVRGPKSGVWVNKAENADINKLKRELPRAGFVGEYTTSPPVPVTPSQIAPGEQEMILFAVEAVMRTSGINAEMMGQTTQKTVSGRAIGARQQGGLVGIGSGLANWRACKQRIGESLMRAIQRHYSPEKMDRVIGQQQRMAASAGILGPQVIPDAEMYSHFKQLEELDLDVVVGFQEASPTARAAVASQMLQYKAAGAPIPMELIIEASDIPMKDEIVAILKKQGESPPNPDLAKALSAGQGQSGPSGVNQA